MDGDSSREKCQTEQFLHTELCVKLFNLDIESWQILPLNQALKVTLILFAHAKKQHRKQRQSESVNQVGRSLFR